MIRLLLLALLAGQVGLAAYLAFPAEGVDEPSMPVRPATPPPEALTIETAVPLADPVARAWREDAVLISAMMRVEWEREPAPPPAEVPDNGLIMLVYAAGDHALSLLIDRPSGVIFEAVVEGWSGGLTKALPLGSIQRSSTVALFAAEVGYGTTYRSGCPEFRHETSVHLVSTEGAANPAWRVIYRDERYRDQPDIVVSVDVVTGNVIAGQAINLVCFPDEGS